MKTKIVYILLGVIMIILIGLTINELIPKSAINSKQSGETTVVVEEKEMPNVKNADKVEVVHFHATQQCWSCSTIGKFTKQIVETKFTGEVANGKMIFKEVNLDLPENKEIIDTFQASGSSLYINAVKDGKNNIVQNMKVWQLVSDETAFTSYLETQLRSLL